VTAGQAKDAISSLCGTSQKTELVQVISAFEVPKMRYDPIRKIFFPVPGRPTLHGSAQARTGLPRGLRGVEAERTTQNAASAFNQPD
jgi:hypothetical protein